MKGEFEFPKTPYLEGPESREDKVISKEEYDRLMTSRCWIQEKLDGSNLNIEYDKNGAPAFTHRGRKIAPLEAEFKKFDEWHDIHSGELFDILKNRFILSGEWMFWKHQVYYSKLPSFFVVYDIFDKKEGKFLSYTKIEDLLKGTRLVLNPVIFEGIISNKETLDNLLGRSQFGDEQMEGLYIRKDIGDYNKIRAKYVSKNFSQVLEGKEHWEPIVKNKSLARTESDWTH